MNEQDGSNEKQTAGRMMIDPAFVRELAEMLGETGLAEIEVEEGDRKVRVSRAAPVAAPAPVAYAAPQPMPVAVVPTAAPATPPAAEDAAPLNAVRSPMVGTCYLAPEPAAAPFATEGSPVKAGDTVLIIEAMKVMNPIIAPTGGTLQRMLVENGQPVEFDQPLFVIV